MEWVLRSTRVVLPREGAGRGATHCVAARQVWVDGATIRAVQPFDAPVAPGIPIVDLGGDLLTPAFVNAHTHLPMNAYRGLTSAAAMGGNVVEELFFAVEHHLQPGDVAAFARMGAYECALAGTGVVWDHYYFAEEVARALADVGLSGVVAPTLQDHAGPGVAWQEAQWEATRMLGERQWADRGIVPAYGPHASDTTSEVFWRRLERAMRDAPLPVHMHLAQSMDEVQRATSRGHAGPIDMLAKVGLWEWAPAVLGVHAMWLSEAERRALPRERFVLGHCPASQAQFAFPAPVERWMADGFRVAVGTDCAASNDGMNVQGELRWIAGAPQVGLAVVPEALAAERGEPGTLQALERRRRATWGHLQDVLTPSALLASVWDVPGTLHPALAVGRIAAGARATLAVWSAEHPALWPMLDPLRSLAFSDTSAALRGLLVQGGWTIPLDGAHALVGTDAYRAAASEASERLALLLERSGIALPSHVGLQS